MPTFTFDHPAMENSGLAHPPPRWACALGVIHAVICAVFLTLQLL